MADVSFRVAAGDKVGLVGRNGAGKTTLTKILSGEGLPATGRVEMTGAVGYLPQDPRTGDLDMPVRERILYARGLDDVVRRLRSAELEMASSDTAVRDRGMRRYSAARIHPHLYSDPVVRRLEREALLQNRILDHALFHVCLLV